MAGEILKTTDGGNNWAFKNSGIMDQLSSVYFTDKATGYIVGGNAGDGVILRTTNGGIHWALQDFGDTIAFSSVYFTDSNTGYVVGSYGNILMTSNGGSNWTSQTSGTSGFLNSVFFTDASNGYIVGDNGIIIKTTNGSGAGISDNGHVPERLKIFPNPASDKFTIETSYETRQGLLSIFNLNCQELLHQTITEATSNIDISSLPCGVYFVKLINDKTVQIGKIIKR